MLMIQSVNLHEICTTFSANLTNHDGFPRGPPIIEAPHANVTYVGLNELTL